MTTTTGKCPFCLWVIAPGEQSVTCEHCSTTYHAECWAENSGCATFGCAAWSQMPQSAAPPTNVAQPTNAFRSNEWGSATQSLGAQRVDIMVRQFCDQCGNGVTPADRFCGICGARMED